MQIQLKKMMFYHFGFWIGYHQARFALLNKPVKTSPYENSEPEYAGWKAGIESKGVKK